MYNIHTQTPTHTYTHTPTYTYTHIHTHTHPHIHTHTPTYTYKHTHPQTPTHTHTHTPTHTHTHIHIHTHILIPTTSQLPVNCPALQSNFDCRISNPHYPIPRPAPLVSIISTYFYPNPTHLPLTPSLAPPPSVHYIYLFLH